MTTNQLIANEILVQLGGNKFIAMTGSKNFIACQNALTMHLTANEIGAKYLKIELMPNDTYTMTFSTSKKIMDKTIGIKVDSQVILKTIEFVTFDTLQANFTSTTGLLTTLGTLGQN